MRTFKQKRLWAFFAVDLLLLAAAAALFFYTALGGGESNAFEPIDAPPGTGNNRIGKLREPRMLSSMGYDYHDDEWVEFQEFLPNGGEDGRDRLVIRHISESKWGGRTDIVNYDLLYYCPEDGFWYILYNPCSPEKAVALGGPIDQIENWDIPAGIITQPGRYALRAYSNLSNLRCACTFTIE